MPVVRPLGQDSFAIRLPHEARILDVGCGQRPSVLKNLRPDLYYVGLDIMAGGNDSIRSIANEYHLSQPSAFDTTIRALGTFDAVISSHNIEHTEKPFEVLEGVQCSAA